MLKTAQWSFSSHEMWQSVPCFGTIISERALIFGRFCSCHSNKVFVSSFIFVEIAWEIAFIEEVGRRQAIYTFEDLDVIFLAFTWCSPEFFFKSICFAWFFFSTTNHFSRPVCPLLIHDCIFHVGSETDNISFENFRCEGIQDFKSYFSNSNVASLRQLWGGKTLLELCLRLPNVSRIAKFHGIMKDGPSQVSMETVSQKETTLLNLTPVRWEWFLEL